jgi:ATP-dependent DNA helicase MPH1
MCKRIIAEAFSDIQKSKSKNRKETEPLYKAVLDLLQRYISGSLPPHPKMAKLKAIAIEHFATTFDREPQDRSEEPKMMVFATLRECVDEIVDFLNQEQPLLRATKFIGQSSDKRGVKGMNQKDQLEVSIILLCVQPW